jgi:hypothetical protein
MADNSKNKDKKPNAKTVAVDKDEIILWLKTLEGLKRKLQPLVTQK